MNKTNKKTLVPRLRFPEFRDAGKWRIKRLGDKDVSKFVNKRVSLDELVLDSYVSTENILPDFEGIKTASKLPPSGSFTSYKPDDILISNIRPYLKKVWISDRNGSASNDVIVVRPAEEIKALFLSSILKSEAFIDYVMKGAKGVKMPRGDISLMKDYPLALPDFEEQQKIADCLSSLDALIAAQTDKIEALKTHKKGLMQQLFPREGETVPRLRFPEFQDSGEWDADAVGNLVELLSGYAFKSEYFSDQQGRKLLTPKNFTKNGFGCFNIENTKLTTESCDRRYICKNGDLLLLLTDLTPSCELLGKPLLLTQDDGEVLLNQRIVKVTPVSSVKTSFLQYFFLTDGFRKRIIATATGSTVRHSSNKIIESTEILFPCLFEQQKIVECLSSLDAMIAAQAEKLDALKTHKKGLMQQLFPVIDEVSR